MNALLDRRTELERHLKFGRVPGWALKQLLELLDRAAKARAGRAAAAAAIAQAKILASAALAHTFSLPSSSHLLRASGSGTTHTRAMSSALASHMRTKNAT
jgi:hypothetical protein